MSVELVPNGTGGDTKKFRKIDRYAVDRLRSFLMKRKGRHLKAGEANRWTREYFEALGLNRA